jgi:hypothetical protein
MPLLMLRNADLYTTPTDVFAGLREPFEFQTRPYAALRYTRQRCRGRSSPAPMLTRSKEPGDEALLLLLWLAVDQVFEILALALDKVIERWVEGTSRDPAILAGVTLLLALVGVGACAIPARRASTVDPMVALRD